MAKYDRDAALAYARKYWNRVASDRYIAQYPGPKTGYKKLDPDTVFVHQVTENGHGEYAQSPDGSIIPWEPIDDCSHFISCVIGDEKTEKGGGLHVPMLEPLGAPSRRPYGIVGAPKLAKWLFGLPGVKRIEITADSMSKIDLATPGDVIGCKGIRPGMQAYEHFMLYLGDGKIACHTYCRCDAGGEGWNDEWDNDWNVGDGAWAVAWTVFVMA